MSGKISTLIAGLEKTLGQLRPEDRVHIVTFSDQARQLTRDWQALTPDNVKRLSELLQSIGKLKPREAEDSIRDLGVNFQLVTDETSIIMMAAEGFERHGIERKNQQRIAAEHSAQTQRQANYTQAQSAGTPVKSLRVDKTPMFQQNAPRIGGGSGGGGGGGGGAFGLETLALLTLTAAGLLARRRNR